MQKEISTIFLIIYINEEQDQTKNRALWYINDKMIVCGVIFINNIANQCKIKDNQ